VDMIGSLSPSLGRPLPTRAAEPATDQGLV
jgi:hypothetical protein